MCKYVSLRTESGTDSFADTVLEIDQSTGINRIRTETQFAATLVMAGRFIHFGEQHTEAVDHEVEAALIPALRHARVTLIGLELPPSMNGFLLDLQNKIHQGFGSNDARAVLKSELARVFAGEQVSVAQADALAKVVETATANLVRVTGIDPRHDDPAWVARNQSNFSDVYAHLLEKDTAAAEIAAAQLDRENVGSRMAIFSGLIHVAADHTGKRPPILAEALGACGEVTRINLVQDDSVFGQDVRRPPNHIVAADLLRDISPSRPVSRHHDSDPSPLRPEMPTLRSPGASPPPVP